MISSRIYNIIKLYIEDSHFFHSAHSCPSCPDMVQVGALYNFAFYTLLTKGDYYFEI